MGQSMTYGTMVKKHPNRFIIAMIDRRHPDSRRAVLFKVLQTCTNVASLKKALGYYETEGFTGVVPVNSYMEDDTDAPEMPPDLTAKFFREYYSM